MQRREPDEGLIDALVQASFQTMAVLTKIGAECDLSLTQLRVLAILRDRRVRMTALADYLGLEKSTMTGLVDRAEQRGLLARAPSADDRRATDVMITKDGSRLAERMYGRVRDALGPMTNRLVGGDRKKMQELLERMIARDDGHA